MVSLKRSLGAKVVGNLCPVWLVATYDKDDKPNMLNAGACGWANVNPPYLQVSIRDIRYSHSAILERKAFTVNIPSEEQWRQADYAGVTSGRNTDKFKDIGFTAIRSELVDAPIIQECPVNFECRLKGKMELDSNTLFIGEVLDVKMDESVLDGETGPDIKRIKPMVYWPKWGWKSEAYYSIGSELGKVYSQRNKPEK